MKQKYNHVDNFIIIMDVEVCHFYSLCVSSDDITNMVMTSIIQLCFAFVTAEVKRLKYECQIQKVTNVSKILLKNGEIAAEEICLTVQTGRSSEHHSSLTAAQM